ncbi:indolepyruvate oxidoreductase subunit beta [Prosthecochloris vibrioformis]|uniref:Indolepyruvate oxidoreductase subunit beta n=1 Tax=Prosthecochloris vibrioformis TaxID=1098 RepID=A0A5C4S280_PROVB|nr:indolepyruvate oxidoreductase subunit beta [Prosthecochloris vibrioformis]TNJ36851.1 indolepyruvate oxidoreductase subunit beta [Prosthecochloris vibrioformis]
MHNNIILAGVGGQGILSIAAVIDLAAIHSGLTIKQAEVHGMSQRGGAVQSHLRIADHPIHSDLIPSGQANLILSIEPMEALRYLPWLRPNGMIVTSTDPVKNIPDYPDEQNLRKALEATPAHLLLSAHQLAKQAGSPRTTNMVILGAAAAWTGLAPNALEHGIRELFQRKGEEIVTMNITAFRSGQQYSNKATQKTAHT